MNPRTAFGLSTLMSLLSAIVIAVLFARPSLRNITTEQALIWLVAPHMVRFIGLSFLVPGVVSGSLPKAWAIPAAYGDFVAGILATIATAGLARTANWQSQQCGSSMSGVWPTYCSHSIKVHGSIWNRALWALGSTSFSIGVTCSHIRTADEK
jgi:hypothetical protein